MGRQRAMIVALAASVLVLPGSVSTALAQESVSLTLAPGSDSGITGTATRLADGTVLVAGGFGTSSQATAERYDPATNTWTSAGSMREGRVGHTATLLPNGKVLVAGGANSTQGGTYLATAELYDPAADGWRPAGALAGPRSGHTATPLPDGRVLVAGGASGNDAPGLEQYDPQANAWTARQ